MFETECILDVDGNYERYYKGDESQKGKAVKKRSRRKWRQNTNRLTSPAALAL